MAASTQQQSSSVIFSKCTAVGHLDHRTSSTACKSKRMSGQSGVWRSGKKNTGNEVGGGGSSRAIPGFEISGVKEAVLLLYVYTGQTYAATEAAVLGQQEQHLLQQQQKQQQQQAAAAAASPGVVEGRRQEISASTCGLRSQSWTKEHQGSRTHHNRRRARCRVTGKYGS